MAKQCLNHDQLESRKSELEEAHSILQEERYAHKKAQSELDSCLQTAKKTEVELMSYQKRVHELEDDIKLLQSSNSKKKNLQEAILKVATPLTGVVCVRDRNDTLTLAHTQR